MPTQKMTSDQFAQSIKAKYPQYDSVDNATLVQKMIAKYPQYADRVNTQPAAPTAGTPDMSGFIPPAMRMGTANAPTAQQGKDFMVGQGKAIASTFQSANVLGTMNKMAGNPTTVGGVPFNLTDKMTAPTTPAQASGFGMERIGETVLGSALSGDAVPAGGGAVRSVGKKVAEMFIPKSTEEAAALRNYKANSTLLDRMGSFLKGTAKAPDTAASAAFNKGLIGSESSMGVQATKAKAKMWKTVIGPALKQSDTRVSMSEFFSQAEAKIATDNPDPTRRKALNGALSAIKKDFKGINNVSLEQLQKYKEGWAKWVPEKAYKGGDIAASVNDVRSTLASQARNHIYETLGPEVKQAYMDYSNLYAIEALADKAGSGGIVKPGGTFTGLKSLFEMATVPIGTVGGQAIYKIGRGMEMVGAPGVRTVGELFSAPMSGSTPQL